MMISTQTRCQGGVQNRLHTEPSNTATAATSSRASHYNYCADGIAFHPGQNVFALRPHRGHLPAIGYSRLP